MLTTTTSGTSSNAVVSEGIVRTMMAELAEGAINQALGYFGDQFKFSDYGIDLHFNDKQQLAEFFSKERELYLDSRRLPDSVFVSGNSVTTQWTLRATLRERWFGGMTRRVPLCVHGVSVAQIENGAIVAWADYYDGLSSRRTALAAHFTDWVES